MSPAPHATAPLRIDVVTIFPELVEHATRFGVTGRARERGLWALQAWNPRDFAAGNYRAVDDRPYGGGPGMVMLAEPLEQALAAIRAAQQASGIARTHVIHVTPAGRPASHARIAELASATDVGYAIVAGRYEGIDERFVRRAVDEEIAIGDIVVSGGELPALMLIDAIVRQRPGVLNDAESAQQESFAHGLLDHPHYTRPEHDGREAVPAVLLSGDHAAIRRWRLKEALGRTWTRRPDLLEGRTLTREEQTLLAEYRREHPGDAGAGAEGSAPLRRRARQE